jgi:hypothetical protein
MVYGSGREVSGRFIFRITVRESRWRGSSPCANLCVEWPVSNPFETTHAAPPYREQRTVPRYEFIATVEVVEPVSDMHLSGRVSEISRKGCFVDILNTLPAGTKINLRVTRDRGAFFTPASIIYVQEGMGMGIAFREPAADQLQILDGWLAELAQ